MYFKAGQEGGVFTELLTPTARYKIFEFSVANGKPL